MRRHTRERGKPWRGIFTADRLKFISRCFRDDAKEGRAWRGEGNEINNLLKQFFPGFCVLAQMSPGNAPESEQAWYPVKFRCSSASVSCSWRHQAFARIERAHTCPGGLPVLFTIANPAGRTWDICSARDVEANVTFTPLWLHEYATSLNYIPRARPPLPAISFRR